MDATYLIQAFDDDTDPFWLSLCSTAQELAPDFGRRWKVTVHAENADDFESMLDTDPAVVWWENRQIATEIYQAGVDPTAERIADWYRAVFGRVPDADDGTPAEWYATVCAAVGAAPF